jgi:hypothetical protein
MFRHELFEEPKVKQIKIDGMRHYETPTGEAYPSVTTVLRQYYKKPYLKKWRERVGEETAKQITARAASRGQGIHKICEKYLANDDKYEKKAMPSTLDEFQNVSPILDNNVTCVHGIEFGLYSHVLKSAGTADLICTWGNTPTIVDFKTSRRYKRESQIEDYFVQASVYGIMTTELFQFDIKQVIVILLVENDFPIVFQKDIELYKDRVNEIFITSRK